MKESARMVRRTRLTTFEGIDQSLVEQAFIHFFYGIKSVLLVLEGK
jgi:hypothetical protein